MDWIAIFFSSPPAKWPELLNEAKSAGFDLEEKLKCAMRFLFSIGQGGYRPDSSDYSKISEKKEIWLRPNEIPTSDPAWDCFIHLKCIGLAECNLVSLPAHFRNADHLEVLYLDNNPELDLAAAWSVLSGMKRLKELYLWNCGIIEFLAHLPRISTLCRIDLNYNEGIGVQNLLDWLKLNEGISELSLEGCAITELPQELEGFSHIQFLNLGDNQLLKLPPAFKNLNSLETVVLSGNPLFDHVEDYEKSVPSGCLVN